MTTTAAARPARLVERLRETGAIALVVVLSLILSYLCLRVISAVDWPAYNSSNVTRALTTVGQVVTIVVMLAAALVYRRGRAPGISSAISAIAAALLVTVTLGMPLGATRLYLFGLSVDQEFRTEYLTRLTSSPRLADMTYLDLPPFYPAGWFWFGGRFADLTGMPGWEAYKPWSIISLAAAAALGVMLWNRMVGVDRGAAAGLAVTLVTLMFASPEPYSAILILVGVPMMIVVGYALRGRGRLADGVQPLGRTSWPAVVASGLFLGVSACCYTLFTGLFALTAVLMALWLLVTALFATGNKAVTDSITQAQRRARALGVVIRLVVMGVIAILVALLVWAPYLLALASNEPASGGTAQHYLPEGGSILPMPMFRFTLVGALCLIGVVWLLLRAGRRTIAQMLLITAVAIYLFCLLSMAVTAVGTTLLSFRMEPLIAAVLAAAGVFGVAELARRVVGTLGDVRFGIAALAALAAIGVAQAVPDRLGHEITVAYTDTDGYGERADHRPAGAASYYREIHELIGEQTGRDATDVVLLTADYGFLSIYPYWGFQGFTSHYANPLAEFDKRAATIEEWSQISDPNEFVAALDDAAWPAPEVFLFRYSPEGYTLRLAEDVYPNDPNVRRYTVTFDPAAFADPRFEVTEVGPFILVVRKDQP